MIDMLCCFAHWLGETSEDVEAASKVNKVTNRYEKHVLESSRTPATQRQDGLAMDVPFACTVFVTSLIS